MARPTQSHVANSPTGSITFAVATTLAFAAAAFVGTSITAASPAAAAACLSDVTHWGHPAERRRHARENARAGMDWKIRTQMGDTVKIDRGPWISQCKRRTHGDWQCQAMVIRNHCF